MNWNWIWVALAVLFIAVCFYKPPQPEPVTNPRPATTKPVEVVKPGAAKAHTPGRWDKTTTGTYFYDDAKRCYTHKAVDGTAVELDRPLYPPQKQQPRRRGLWR